jgi:ATP-dependent Clp protease adaptor protein ClpS
MSGTAPVELERPETEEITETHELTERDIPWIVIVWNDPINLMSYVT